MGYAADKQTDKQIDSKILPKLTDIVYGKIKLNAGYSQVLTAKITTET